MTVENNLLCCSCEASSPKYKCPVCRLPYCSVKCCNDHKSSNCSPTPSAPSQDDNANSRRRVITYPSEDTLPMEQLQNLRNNERLREYLRNSHLREIMELIDKAPNPTDLIAQAMLEPIFVEFATECLKMVQPEDKSNDSYLDEDITS